MYFEHALITLVNCDKYTIGLTWINIIFLTDQVYYINFVRLCYFRIPDPTIHSPVMPGSRMNYPRKALNYAKKIMQLENKFY